MEEVKGLYLKHKKLINYLFFGGCAFLVSILSFYVANKVIHLNEHLANIISWVLAVLFAFFTNKFFVFESKTSDPNVLTKELLSFFTARLLTLGLEELILFVGFNLFHVDALVTKIIAQMVIIVSNYFLSSFFVFKHKINT